MGRRIARRKMVSAIFADVAKYSLTFGAIGRFIAKEVDPSIFLGILVISAISLAIAFFALPND